MAGMSPARAERAETPSRSVADIRRAFLDPASAEGLIVRGQLRQDLLALVVSGFKRGRFFVEFGATDGEKYSNSNLLDLGFGWDGILSEPATGWHRKLRRKRNCVIDTRCVWTETGAEMSFDMASSRTLSTLTQFAGSDHHAKKRVDCERITVETVSLLDLLQDHGAPAEIDYLSVDTEGSEFDILNAFDFRKYRFGLITVEHNFTPQREMIHELLTGAGYQRVFEDLSQFDDWYIPL